MPFKKIIAVLLFIQLFSCSKKNETLKTEINIIPKPLRHFVTSGNFNLNSSAGVSYPEEFKISAQFLKTFIEEGSTIKLQEGNDIRFIFDQEIKTAEGYILEIKKNIIKIKARTDQGAFYAVQSLRQLLPPEFENGTYKKNTVAIPCLHITDAPSFKYRGMHLDVGRHMYSVAFIKKYIDALALLKMNTFHWHLTEDQGWRIEIKKYPKLQTVAAFRNETLIGHYSDQPHQFDGKKYGGFYTQEAIKDIVKYAQDQHVTIIPEIELPGHSQAAIAAYPELGCSGEQIQVATKWGVFDEVYCTKDETFEFIENVLDEVLELFPGTYIHIGGDEAPKTKWKSCANCQKRIKDEGLKDEHELQNYFITRIENYLNSKGRQIIGWDEILEGGLAPNATVMSWRGTKGAVEAAKANHNVVMTPTSHCYFDYYQSDNANEPLAIGGFLPLEKVYHFNPIPEELSNDESKYILGAQGNIWTEYMPTEAQVEYMAFPRLLAMSEVVWTHSDLKNYDEFVSNLEHFHKRLDALDINYANHLYEVEGELISTDEESSYQLKTLTKGKSIRYTLDNSEPDLNSIMYSEAIPITESMTIKTATFNSEEKLGSTYTQSINFHKAVGKQITVNVVPHKAYSGSGTQGLINGISGSDSRYGDKEWLGFWGDDLEITIDLGEEKEINSITTRFHNGQGQWIYAPKSIEIGFDTIKPLAKIKILDSKLVVIDVQLKTEIKSRFIHLKIPSYGIIPKGKQGAGNKAWTFIDEIIVN